MDPSLNTQEHLPQQSVPQMQQAAPTQGAYMGGQLPLSVQKKNRRTGITAIILGIFMVIVGLAFGFFYDFTEFGSILFGVVYLVFGKKLMNNQATVTQTLLSLRVLAIVVLVNVAGGLILGTGVGILPLLLILFIALSFGELFKTGLTTSGSAVTAKPVNRL